MKAFQTLLLVSFLSSDACSAFSHIRSPVRLKKEALKRVLSPSVGFPLSGEVLSGSEKHVRPTPLAMLLPKLRQRKSIGLLLIACWFMVGTSAAWGSDIGLLSYDERSMTPLIFPRSVTSGISALTEVKLVGRLIFAAISGSVVGWERSASKHSAGVRTMALVSLGAAAFTICSAYGFSGRADPSRMAANVASGVGFLGAGVITTHATMNRQRNYSIVHGLTTAAAIWLSAALGVASGVGLYLVSGTTALTTVVILRLGKRKARRRRRGFEDREWQEEGDDTWEEEKNIDSYHLSDTHDTSDWDEVPDDVVPPYPVGDSLATSFRTVPAAAPVLPPDTEYPPQFEFRNESAIEQIFGISSGKQAKNMTAVDANIMTP